MTRRISPHVKTLLGHLLMLCGCSHSGLWFTKREDHSPWDLFTCARTSEQREGQMRALLFDILRLVSHAERIRGYRELCRPKYSGVSVAYAVRKISEGRR